jgi:hypothetical protein
MAESSPTGLWAVWWHVPLEYEEEFNAWYNTERLPQITRIPGVLKGRRYQALDGVPKYLALYDLQDETIIAGRAFQQATATPTPWAARMLRVTQDSHRATTYRLLSTAGTAPVHDTPYLYIGTHDIAIEFEQEFNAWYDQEHAPGLARVPGCPRVQRFLAINSQPKYMAIDDLERLDVIKSVAWATARDTEWTARLRPHRQNRTRQLYQLIFPTT